MQHWRDFTNSIEGLDLDAKSLPKKEIVISPQRFVKRAFLRDLIKQVGGISLGRHFGCRVSEVLCTLYSGLLPPNVALTECVLEPAQYASRHCFDCFSSQGVIFVSWGADVYPVAALAARSGRKG